MVARTDPAESGSTTPQGRSRVRTRLTRLSTEQVLAAALEIVDHEGVDALSMRRLAQALDRDAMSLYRYAQNKAALLDGVVDLVLRELVIDCDAQEWAQELRLFAHRYRDLALEHPNVVPLLVTRPLATPLGLRPPGTLRPLEDFLELLVRAGFSPPNALHSYRLFFGFLQGHILDELQELVEDPEESEDLLRLGLHRLPRSKFPRLRSLASELADYDGAHRLDTGLDIIIDGLESHFRNTAAATGE
ncbi:TetR/AcrR family transcriptional regulator C-terminal domain-containing protein [Rhodococcus sp. ZPP]|uniref:TetR/AcrR family transcriptional regulator C-terminal domain-containing protein n=1 Tax=Rhodococcus sp. ZPP TaxID=2749906 RepID=UPI001AD88A46|nr:TetR/AcrR family transcriptional regulator C-terminal domain-containing protein [Rhodococcus sp. ZPP]QTJ65757.1 TetR/AcrR family transcriptional regulator C-terminal domain-containing protein [Rhodococcus sp. ZPP]